MSGAVGLLLRRIIGLHILGVLERLLISVFAAAGIVHHSREEAASQFQNR